MARRTARQLPLDHKRHGGARLGAGRKKKPGAGVPHARRPDLTGREPVHVTLRIADDVIRLRSRRSFQVICAALAAAYERPGFDVACVSVQGNHLHLLIEPADARTLSLGVKSLAARLARGLNRLVGRTGPVFPDRYHAHVLKTPAEVRNTLRYVFGNTASRAARNGRPLPPGAPDPYTFGYFGDRAVLPSADHPLVVEPSTWLLTRGWRRARAAAGRPEVGPADGSTDPEARSGW